jgi:hypothetical protein
MIAGECSLLVHREILLQRNLGRYRGKPDIQQAAFHSIGWSDQLVHAAPHQRYQHDHPGRV